MRLNFKKTRPTRKLQKLKAPSKQQLLKRTLQTSVLFIRSATAKCNSTMALNKLCLSNKEKLIFFFVHKKSGYYKFCSSNKTTPKNTATLKKFPRKMWFRQGNNLTFKRFCSTARSRKKKKKKQIQ